MRILLDENLPASLAEALGALGHDVEHVYTRNLSGHPDPDVRALAQAEDRFLIMQDKKFADTREFVPGTHPGVLFIRMKHPGRLAVRARVIDTFRREDVESWRGCFVVLTDTKLRVRCPE